MARPISLSEVVAIPDILGSFRHVVQFDVTPGAGSRNVAGLRIKNVSLTMPQIQIGQVRTPVFNFPRSFRGFREHQNRFSASFYEDSNGNTWKTLWEWHKRVIDPETFTSLTQSNYSVNCEIELFDTTGKPAITYIATRVWPIEMTPPELETSNTEPAVIQVEFSMDNLDFSYG